MSYAKVRAILDAATPGNMRVAFGGSGAIFTDDDWNDATVEVYGERYGENARAIVVARNLAPELLAVAEAAERYLEFFEVFNYPDSAAMYPKGVRDALDALHAKMKETLT